MNEKFQQFLTSRLCANEGGHTSVIISYDDATCNYLITQKRNFTVNSPTDFLGYGRSIYEAFLDAIYKESQNHD